MKPIFTFFLIISAFTRLQAVPGGYFAAPLHAATNLVATTADGDRISLQWQSGDGAHRIVVARKDAPVSAVPVNGVNYSASSAFQQGNEIAPGEFVVYNGTGTSVSISGLLSSSTYYFAVFEYNGTGASIEYLTTPGSVSGTTVTAPTVQPSGLLVSSISGHSMKLSWTNPLPPNAGTGRLVVIREGAPVNVNPADLVSYPASTLYGMGGNIGNGNYVVLESNSNQVTVDELKPNTTYYFAVFEYKGSSALVYNINNPPTASATTLPRPQQPSTAMSVSGVEGNAMTISITKGDGARRLVIAKAGSPVTAVPQDGVSYSSNGVFGSGQQIAPGEYVVSNSTTASLSLANLSIGTTYYFAVYEYDGTGSYTAYLTSNYLSASQSTVSAPTVAASNVTITNPTSSTFTINWQAGNGARRLVVVRKTDPVNAVPANLSYYSPNTSFQMGSNVGPGNYSVYSGNGSNSVTVSGLIGGNTYQVAIFEYNGSSAPVYLTSSYATASVSLSQAPSAPATGLQFTTIEGNRFNVQWQSGNGNSRMVVAREGSPVTATPVDGTVYTSNNSFASAPEIAAGQKIVFNNGQSNFTLFGLTPGKTYYFAVYEYNTIGGVTYYQAVNPATGSQATVAAPTTATTSLSFTNITGNSMRLNWVNGNGGNRLVLLKAGSPVDAQPSDFTGYTANTNLTLASQLTNGNYIVYNGSQTSATITGLNPGITYYYKIFEYNGAAYPVYLTAGALAGSQQTHERPAVAASGINAYQIEGNKMTLRWTNGDGARRIVVARQGSPVTAMPVDGTVYTASNTFGSGTALAPGQFVLFDETYSETNVLNLQPGTIYYFAVFEYDGTGSDIRYQTASYGSGSQATLSAPVTQTTNVLFSSVSSTTVNVNWTSGSGANHLVIARKGAPVNATPQDLHYYSPFASFGNAASVVSGDNYAVYSSTGSSTSVTGLQPGTTYYFAVFDFNGFSGPVYNSVSPAIGSVTTLGAPSDPATNLNFVNLGSNTTVKIAWTNGSGQKRLVLVREDAPVNAVPALNTLYNANSFFGSGDQVGTGNFAVYSGAADNITINNLTAGKTYYFAVFEYNQFSSGPMYLTSNAATGIFAGFALPVRLTSFSGSVEQTANVLRWTTAQETNSGRFAIERSSNGNDYAEIGSVDASGNSNTTQHYSFEDANRPAAAFYRLRMIDADGRSSYSQVVQLRSSVSPETALVLYPTMAADQVTLQLHSVQNTRASVTVVSVSGQVIYRNEISVAAGENAVKIGTDRFAKGSYIVNVMVSGKRLSKQFMKL